MRESRKKSKTAKLIALAGVSSLMLLMNACSSTPVLQDNGDVPPPSLNPPENANQIASPGIVEESVQTPTEKVQISSPVTQTAPVSQVKYTVKKGDSLWKVAKMFDVSVNELAAFNNIDPKSSLKSGQTLQIPPAGLAQPRDIPSVSAPSTAKTSDKASAPVSGSTYTVKSGDSLWTVAKKNHTSVKKLAEANNLSSEASLKVGQKLTIPGSKATAKAATTASSDKKTSKADAAPATATSAPVKQDPKAANSLINNAASTAPTTQTAPASAQAIPSTAVAPTVTPAIAVAAAPASYLPHTVKDGDTWQTISDMYGVSIDDLKKVNPSIAGDAQPKVGAVVNIPEE